MNTVSIVLCTYNGAAYLRPQLDSLVAQTYPIHEIIVQDDGSTDSTPAIVADYARRYPRLHIRFFANERSRGFNRNFLTAYLRATGDLIASCDQDDVWEPGKLARMMEMLTPSTAFVFHNSELFNTHGPLGPLHRKPLPARPAPLSTLLMPQSYGHQMLFRRAIVGRLKPFVGLNVSYDYFINTLSISLGEVAYLDKLLVHWRRHAEASTFRARPLREARWRGYARAIRALGRRRNRRITRRYFRLLTHIDFPQPEVRRVVALMADGSLPGLLGAGLLCLRHRRELAPELSGATQWLRAFFVPLFFVRDYGQYILQDD